MDVRRIIEGNLASDRSDELFRPYKQLNQGFWGVHRIKHTFIFGNDNIARTATPSSPSESRNEMSNPATV